MRGNAHGSEPETLPRQLGMEVGAEETDCEVGREQKYQERKNCWLGPIVGKTLEGARGGWRWERDLPKEGRDSAAGPMCGAQESTVHP